MDMLVLSKYTICSLYVRKATTEHTKTVFNFTKHSAINTAVRRSRMILKSCEAMGLL